MKIQRDPSRVPLIPVVFNIDMGMDSNVNFEGLTFKLLSNPRAFETFEIFLNASGSEDSFVLEWSYNTTLFKASTIKGMMLTFEKILKKTIKNPNIQLGNIIEFDQSAYSILNDTASTYPNLPLNEVLAKQAKKTPNKIALQFGNNTITYNQFINKSNKLANQLVSKGIKPGDCIGVCIYRSIELVVVLNALMQCGAIYIPLDPNYPSQRLNYMLKDSGAKFLISTKEVTSQLQSEASILLMDELFANLSSFTSTPILEQVFTENPVYILYTSGSTGNPKGVVVTHKNLVNFLYSMLEKPGITEFDKLLSITTISFDIAGLELFLPLISGATLVLTSENSAKDGRELLDILNQENITMLQATPTTWQMLLEIGWEKHLPIKALCGGEPLPLNLAKKLLPKVNELWNMYGPTETTIWSTIKQIHSDEDIITIGHPIANTQIYIVNESSVLMPPGKTGEIVIGGNGVSNGYWKQPDLTANKFIANSFDEKSSTKLYKTGDLGLLLSNGELQCLGRIDHQIKLRGHRIELEEIEQALDTLDDIQQSVVVVKNEKLAAYLKSNTHKVHNKDKVENWKIELLKLLPSHMVPTEFYHIEEFPTTLNGKIDRKALLKLPTDQASKKSNSLPTTTSEKIISKIWKEVLGLDNIDIDSDFFQIGGHSIIGVKVMAKLEKETGKRLPLVSLLKHPTIRSLATYMDNEFYTWNSLVPLKTNGTKPPLYIIHGANHQVLIFDALAHFMDKDQPVYGLQSRGLNGVDEPHDSIDQMAADYIKEIVASNPKGPYALAGFSYGGIVAYEMARQLRAQGKKVTILAQFDTYVFPQYYYKSPIIKKAISILYVIGKIGYLILNMFSSKKNFVRRYELLKLLFKGYYLRLRHGRAKQYEMQFNVPIKLLDYHNKATSKYTISPQDIVIDLFRASEEVNLVHDHKYLGWKKMALKGIRKQMVRGNHVDMFEKPHVKDFANKLQNVLDNYNLEHYD